MSLLKLAAQTAWAAFGPFVLFLLALIPIVLFFEWIRRAAVRRGWIVEASRQ